MNAEVYFHVVSLCDQATRDLQAVYKDPSIISALCDLLLGSGNPQVLSVPTDDALHQNWSSSS